MTALRTEQPLPLTRPAPRPYTPTDEEHALLMARLFGLPEHRPTEERK